MTLTERAIADLRLVAELWPSLVDSRIPGTPVPYREPTITPERRAELDHEARVERIERNGLAPGEHPDAARAEVLDLMGSLLIDAERIADEVAEDAGLDLMDPPSTAFADPAPYLLFAVEHLPAATGEVVRWAATKARQMAGEVVDALGLRDDGQLLRVICPWCRGNWFGHRTLRVRILPGGMVGIVCEAPLCSPPLGDVGTWWNQRPVWPLHMWPWLAKRVLAAERRERMTV